MKELTMEQIKAIANEETIESNLDKILSGEEECSSTYTDFRCMNCSYSDCCEQSSYIEDL